MKNPNLDILIAAVRRLRSIADEMVFVGGCATGLLLTDPAAHRCGSLRIVFGQADPDGDCPVFSGNQIGSL
jgi:hypothetical protein